MNAGKLRTILDQHKLWIKSHGKKGKRADLSCQDLNGADLQYANLSCADFHVSDLSHAKLRNANLQNANLRHADLYFADLNFADLRDADLRGADIDYSSWPLWCGSLSPKIDKRIAAQLLYHALRAMQSCADDPDVAAVLRSKANIRLASYFHRVRSCGRIKFSGN